MKSLSYILFFVVALLLFFSCANQTILTGGEKDETPPQIDTTSSTKNYQLRYFPSEVHLEFDEFINLRSPSKNIAISPPLNYIMDVKHRGKEVHISFDEREELKENVTYIINFGEAIVDYTEGNKLNNYAFVWSTGDYIDSLTLKGRILDAFSKEPIKNMTVMLYDNVEDSVVFKEKPFYFTKTEDDGSFQFQNLRADTFKIAALNDLNLNFLYEENSELFAFQEELVIVDTLEADIRLFAFMAESPPRFNEGKILHDGLAILQFDQNLSANPATLIDDVDHYFEIDNKNVLCHVNDVEYYPLRFEIKTDTLLDTISIRKPQTKDRKVLPELKRKGSNVYEDIGLHPDDTLKLTYNFPLDSLSYEILNMDTSEIFIDRKDKKVINVIDDWEEGGDYVLTLDSSAVWDFYGSTMDSSGFQFEIARQNAFGSFEIQFENREDSSFWILSITNAKNELIQSAFINQNTPNLELFDLPPGVYSYQIIKDDNGDQRWNTGDYNTKRQPEKVTEGKFNALESNRSNIEIIDFSNIFTPIDSSETEIQESEIDN